MRKYKKVVLGEVLFGKKTHKAQLKRAKITEKRMNKMKRHKIDWKWLLMYLYFVGIAAFGIWATTTLMYLMFRDKL